MVDPCDHRGVLIHRLAPVLLVLAVLAAACTSGAAENEDVPTTGAASSATDTADESTEDPTTTDPANGGLAADVLLEGLEGPTQISPHPDGGFVLAELGPGGEGQPTGRVSRIDLDDPDATEVLVEGLNTPTGVTVADDRLWIMEPERLLVAPLDGGETEVVFEDMPNNGRSNGTITTLADGSIVFDTAGRRDGNEAAENSGTLWNLDPAADDAGGPNDGLAQSRQGEYGQILLTGMKHAYAVAELPDGRLAVTEMSDGTYDGEGAPDELVVIDLGAPTPPTGGWPRCIGNRQPVEEYDGTAAECEATVPSRALFDVAATPTGVAMAPWDEDLALVTNWTRDTVVGVDLEAIPPVDSSVLLSGVSQPQHLLADGDRVLLTAHGEGQIVALSQG